jgi:dihydrofolate synthase/folylpolyglutamate synthase
VQNAQWPARLQHLTHGSLQTLLSTEDQLWLDGGHNPAAAHAIAHWCETNQVEHLTCVISMLNDKDIEGFLTPLAPHITKLIAVPIPNEPKAHEPQSIAAIAKKLGIDVEISHTVEKAIQQQKSNLVAHHTFLICGSLYLAGTVLEENS